MSSSTYTHTLRRKGLNPICINIMISKRRKKNVSCHPHLTVFRYKRKINKVNDLGYKRRVKAFFFIFLVLRIFFSYKIFNKLYIDTFSLSDKVL